MRDTKTRERLPIAWLDLNETKDSLAPSQMQTNRISPELANSANGEALSSRNSGCASRE